MIKENYYIGYGAKNNGIISKEKAFTRLNGNKKLSKIQEKLLQIKKARI
jgi:hypothetical protein